MGHFQFQSDRAIYMVDFFLLIGRFSKTLQTKGLIAREHGGYLLNLQVGQNAS